MSSQHLWRASHPHHGHDGGAEPQGLLQAAVQQAELFQLQEEDTSRRFEPFNSEAGPHKAEGSCAPELGPSDSTWSKSSGGRSSPHTVLCSARQRLCSCLSRARKKVIQVLVVDEVCWPASSRPISRPAISSSLRVWPSLGDGK